jgi:hypothetical protein
MKTGSKEVMITEFRVVFKDLETAQDTHHLKTFLGYKNVSITKIDEHFAVNWDRK